MKTFVLRNVNKGIKIITFCDIKKKMFVILHNNYKVEENMEIFLRLLLVLVVLFPMSEVTALTDKNSDIWREKSDAVDIEHQTLSKIHKLEKTICQLDSEGEKEPTDSGCSFPPPSIQTDEGEMQDLETFKKENQESASMKRFRRYALVS